MDYRQFVNKKVCTQFLDFVQRKLFLKMFFSDVSAKKENIFIDSILDEFCRCKLHELVASKLETSLEHAAQGWTKPKKVKIDDDY